MGPYCKFCGQRCFTPFPDWTPDHILAAYGKNTIVATCAGGQGFEKARIGYCFDDFSATAADSAPVAPDHGLTDVELLPAVNASASSATP